MIQLDNTNFDGVLATAGMPVLVDFWAPWCGPCRRVAPVLEELERENQGRVAFGKVNVDECEEIAARFGIRSIPTVIVFVSGKPVIKQIGAAGKSVYADMIRRAL